MATSQPSSGDKNQVSSNFSKWDDVSPKNVDSEDAMGEAEVSKVWAKMLSIAGLPTATEKEQLMFRAAVYVYGCVNGTSRAGNYAGTITMRNGTSFPAAVVPQAAGKFKIRKFFRGNMKESYTYLKTTGVMETYPRFIAKAARVGVSASAAFAMADWLDDCPSFTPEEARAHDSSFTRGVERARRARDGRTLEEVENEVVDGILEVNGPMVASGNHENGHGSVMKF